MYTADTVADWMFRELSRRGMLRHKSAVAEIRLRFGTAFLYLNERGNYAISREALKAFNQLAKGAAKWDRRHRRWSMPIPREVDPYEWPSEE